MIKNRVNKIFYDILKIHRNIRRSPEVYNILLVNILILVMVIFMEPNRYIVIAAYFFETLIIGISNVIKMLIISLFSPARNEKPDIILDKSQVKGFSSPLQQNLFLILFFILHFSIFYFVQLGLMVGAGGSLDGNFPGSNSFLPDPFAFFKETFGEQGIITVIAIILMQLFSLIYSFIMKGEYKVTSCIYQAIQPYGRIILQQIVVLVGGFFIILMQDPVVFSCMLIIIKTFVDVYAQKKHDTKITKRLGEKY